MLQRKDIRLRDPFVIYEEDTKKYYLFGSTDADTWGKTGVGFDVYESDDLEHFGEAISAFRPDSNFWGEYNFWAPEVFKVDGAYYMFATFKSDTVHRGTAILKADKVTGPYLPHSQGAVTPADWECLDGTLYIDKDGVKWMVFCHEWQQVGDGEMALVRLTDDLKAAASEPQLLFRASEAEWSSPNFDTDFEVEYEKNANCYVTDGPFLFEHPNGKLFMLWSTHTENGYGMGLAVSESGSIQGPWKQDRLLYDTDGGHGMIFQVENSAYYMTIHSPNQTGEERAIYLPLQITAQGLALQEE